MMDGRAARADTPGPENLTGFGPRVVSVNVGQPRTVPLRTRPVTTSIWKHPVTSRVRAVGDSLEGDTQTSPHHGGFDRAVYAYSSEDIAFWEGHLGRTLSPGAMGENLTVTGIDPAEALIGERWAVGSTILEISGPRSPCRKLSLRHDDPTLPRAFIAAERPGAYLRIIAEGDIGAGDPITIISRPGHEVTVRITFRAWLIDRSLVSQLRGVPQFSPSWKRWIAQH
jgi:MOSC domain-containing protein YiiM